jgi:hypothetical protein
MLIGSQLMQWFKDSVENYAFEANDITVILLNGDHIPIQAWNFIKAWPVKWDISEFNAEQGTIVIESIEFAYQYFRRLDVTSLFKKCDMIEIRELVIRATVEDLAPENRGNSGNRNSSGAQKKECCSENIDVLLQIIKDKKER